MLSGFLRTSLAETSSVTTWADSLAPCRCIRTSVKIPAARAIDMKGTLGIPGTIAKSPIMIVTKAKARGWPKNWAETSFPRLISEADLVMIKPVAIEIRRALT